MCKRIKIYLFCLSMPHVPDNMVFIWKKAMRFLRGLLDKHLEQQHHIGYLGASGAEVGNSCLREDDTRNTWTPEYDASTSNKVEPTSKWGGLSLSLMKACYVSLPCLNLSKLLNILPMITPKQNHIIIR